LDSIDPGKSQSLEVKLIPTLARFDNIADQVEFSVKSSNITYTYQYNAAKFVSECFIGGVIEQISSSEISPFNNLNVLVFGIPGVGKSSWIVSAFNAFSKRKQNGLTTIGGNTGHNTQDIRIISMEKEIPGLKIRLWDTWGLNSHNYKEQFLTKLMKGHVPSKYSLDDYNKGIEPIKPAFSLQNRIHAVVFCISYQVKEDDQEKKN